MTPDPFESFIEAQLQQHLGPLVGSAIAPSAGRFAAAAVSAGISASAGGGLLGALSTKSAAAIAAVSIAAGGGGAVAATVATGSANPTVWGQQVKAAVDGCKADLGPHDHGIGKCVSDFASGQLPVAAPAPVATGTVTPAHGTPSAAPEHKTGTPKAASPKAATPKPSPSPSGSDHEKKDQEKDKRDEGERHGHGDSHGDSGRMGQPSPMPAN